MNDQRRPRLTALTLAMTSALTIVATAAPFAALTVRPGVARADSSTEASEHFQRGVEFSKDGDFEAALVEFKRAYELSPNYRVLFNLGQTSRELRDYAGALKSFQQYLKEGGNEVQKRDKVEAWIEELKGKVAYVNVKVNVPGAEVLVDDVSVGTAPLKTPVVVNAGKRKVSVTLSGYTPMQKYVDLAGTDSKNVDIELAPIGAGDSGKPKGNGDGSTGPVAPARKASPAPWIALAGTGAAGVLTGVFGGLALSAKSDFSKALGTFPGNAKDIEAKRSKAKTFAATADVLGGVTGAGAVVTIVLFATQPKSDAPKDEKKASLVPEIGVGFGSLQVSGRF